jgi:HK97 family phage portal protein
MSWIDRLFKREVDFGEGAKRSKVADGGNYTEKVVWVSSAAAAMKVAAVYRAVNLISSSAAVLSLQYKRKNRAKDYFVLDETEGGRQLNYLLTVQPNRRMNAYTMRKYLVAQLLLQGNAFIYPIRSSMGKVLELVLCSPGSVTYDVYTNTYAIADTTNGIYESGIDSEEILHFKNMCNDGGYWGLSTIGFAAQTLSIAATADAETLKRFGTGGRFKAILQNNQTVKGIGEYQDDEMQGLGDELQESLNRGDDILVMKGDGQLTPISMSSADMQFLESRKFTIREIARFFNVPPSKLMDDSNANYKSVEVSQIAFYAEALQPIVAEIEREFTAKFLDERTFLDYKFVHDLTSLYALDLDSRAKWDKARLENGQASVNDLRRESDKEPVEKGDEILMSVNLAPLGSAKLSGEVKSE